MVIVGLTGGIASGKSTVSNMINSIGIPIVDADIIAREAMDLKEVKDNVLKRFGPDILNSDGTINRKSLGDIVFKDKEKLKDLNRIIHPVIFKLIKNKIEYHRDRGEKACLIDAALLIETGLYSLTDYVILVCLNEKEQIKRLMKRDNLSYDAAINRIKSQMTMEEKKKYADFIIDNSGDLEETRKQLILILKSAAILEDYNV